MLDVQTNLEYVCTMSEISSEEDNNTKHHIEREEKQNKIQSHQSTQDQQTARGWQKKWRGDRVHLSLLE